MRLLKQIELAGRSWVEALTAYLNLQQRSAIDAYYWEQKHESKTVSVQEQRKLQLAPFIDAQVAISILDAADSEPHL